MFNESGSPKIAVGLATVNDLSATARGRADAERRASRIAARRAIRRIAGDDARIEVRRRIARAPIAHIARAHFTADVSLSLTHRDGRAAAVAGPAGALVGIDIERLDSIPEAHERFFLTSRERCLAR